MHHNPKKNTPSCDTPLTSGHLGLDWLPDWQEAINKAAITEDQLEKEEAIREAKAIRKKGIENYAERVARHYKESRFENDQRRFRKKKTRHEIAERLRDTHRDLEWTARFLFNEPENPTIRVHRFDKNRRVQEDIFHVMKLIDYLVSEKHLLKIADCLDSFISPRGGSPKYAIAAAAEEIDEIFRGNLGRPNTEMIGEIILKIFPEAQKRNGSNQPEGDLTDWIRQLIKRGRKKN